MRAFVLEKYGDPAFLECKNRDKKDPQKGEVLVKVMAVAINDFDWSLVTGRPFLYRLLFGLFKLKNPIPGIEFSGVVAQVGDGVKSFAVGDEVFGDVSDESWGTFSEYLTVSTSALNIKPKKWTFSQAASAPHAGLLAYQGMFELGQIKENLKVLVNGAGGGVGTFAIQLAKQKNCHVTAVDSSDKFSTMKELGADKLIDYREHNFTEGDDQYDLILDAKTTYRPSAYQRVLKSNGRYVTVGGKLWNLMLIFMHSKVFKNADKKMKVLGLKPNKDMDKLIQQLPENFQWNIDGPYKFEEIPRLIKRFGAAEHRGKIVANVGE